MIYPRLLALVFAACVLSSSSAREITTEEIKEKAALGFHLLSFAAGAEPVWKSEEETDALVSKHAHFIDVTDTYEDDLAYKAASFVKELLVVSYPPPSHQREIAPIIGNVSLSTMQGYLTKLTSFNNRYYKAPSGQEASVWIRNTVADVITQYPTSKASVSLYVHPSWLQNSIVAKIPGSVNPNGAVTILGAHMDSIGGGDLMTSRAPGADDDGTGTVNLLEAFRVLMKGEFRPATPVEFHWYALSPLAMYGLSCSYYMCRYSGEEAGLRGSGAIAADYKKNNVQVKSMLQLDMTAYVKPGTQPVIAFMPDYTNANLTEFAGRLVDTYTTAKWVISEPCGYGCSDHASWHNRDYPAILPFEGLFSNINKVIHTPGDTVNVTGFSWSHSLEYAKLAAAFAYELGA
ncbi:hypothetical protein M413DRAFT_244225 [Hebeloma cylindrosporum]|uniref:Peptide hydrolase n=1 Tax=Hebeloma cylindrosporum TaxID=76867 RepID=A0A0C3C1Z8_HEBCY|nr:hypothetical protein M413DRAFT_244225 [Hebeloma cylindrosporum h7]